MRTKHRVSHRVIGSRLVLVGGKRWHRERALADFLRGFCLEPLLGPRQAGDFSIDAGKTAEQLREKGQALLEEQKARFAEAIEDGKQAAARKKEELLAQLEAARAGDDSIEVAEQDV